MRTFLDFCDVHMCVCAYTRPCDDDDEIDLSTSQKEQTLHTGIN